MPVLASNSSGMGVNCLRLERSILRRWPNAAAVTRPRVITEHAGCGLTRGVNATTADATLGGGVKASAGRCMTMWGSVRHCARTESRDLDPKQQEFRPRWKAA